MSNSNNKVGKYSQIKLRGKASRLSEGATGNQEMELKGILQYQKGDLKEKVNNTKEKITEKFNDTFNKK